MRKAFRRSQRLSALIVLSTAIAGLSINSAIGQDAQRPISLADENVELRGELL